MKPQHQELKIELKMVLKLLGKFGNSCFAGLKDKQH